jgi:arylsulfatase B
MFLWVSGGCQDPAPRDTDDELYRAALSDGHTATTATTASTAHTAHTGVPPAPPQDVLLVVLDDVGAEKIGVYGESTEARTPVIDGLAADGVLFRNAWAYPSCSPTRAALQFGRHARRTGYGSNEEPEDQPFRMDAAEKALPALLSTSPWHTWSFALLGKWHLPVAGTPWEVGWPWYAGSIQNLTGLTEDEHGSYYAWRKTLRDGTVADWTTYATTDTANDAIEAVTTLTEPWVVVVNFNAPHLPLEAPPEELHTRGRLRPPNRPLVLQHAMLEAADTELGRVLAALPPDVRARTTVFVLGDNGSPRLLVEDRPLGQYSGKRTLADSGIRVPFIVQGAAVGAPGSESDALVHVVDVVPTVLALAGVDQATLPGVRDPSVPLVLDGVNLLPVLADPTLPAHETLYAERLEPNGFGPYFKDERAIRDARYKLVRDAIHGVELFHEYAPGAVDQGPNLLPAGLDATQQAAYDRLSAELSAQVAAMVADAPLP